MSSVNFWLQGNITMVTFFMHSLGRIALALTSLLAFTWPLIWSQGCALLAPIYLGLVRNHSSNFWPLNDSHLDWAVAKARRLPVAWLHLLPESDLGNIASDYKLDRTIKIPVGLCTPSSIQHWTYAIGETPAATSLKLMKMPWEHLEVNWGTRTQRGSQSF